MQNEAGVLRATLALWIVVVIGGCAIGSASAQTLTWLGTLGGSSGGALSVSADGTVVVGYAANASNSDRAFRWTAATGMQDLGLLGGTWSGANGVSADGTVVVGEAYYRAFRWTSATGMQDLGTLGGGWRRAEGVSADGTVVVGYAANASNSDRAFRWTAATGMEDLNQTYASLLTNNSRLDIATAITPDLRYIVGRGWNTSMSRQEAFLLDTGGSSVEGDINGDGCVDDADLLTVLFAFGNSGSNLPEDVNGDGVVDDADLLIVLLNFGRRCGQ